MKENGEYAKRSALNMADRRKQIKQIYAGNDEYLNRIFDKTIGRSSKAIYTEERLNTILRQVGLRTLNIDDVKSMINYANTTDLNFVNIVDYYSKMFLWRYYYFPVQVKEKASQSDYGEMYKLMTEVIDGLSIETVFPMLLTNLELEGAVYLYTEKQTSSKTISTTVLNSKYCTPVTKSQYGTGIFMFDVKYFDDLGLNKEQLMAVLDLYPSDIAAAYASYKSTNKNRQVVLDGRYSTYISQNANLVPNKIGVLSSLFDYGNYRTNEVERSTAQLDRIITHKIPNYEGDLLFELPEVKALHSSMSSAISNNTRTRLMTTFGEVAVHPMQESGSVQNETLQKGHEAIYRASGLNPAIFTGSIKESIEISLKRDQATVWHYITQLLNFYNVAINNLYNFKGYQVQLNMLPVTHYNLQEMMDLYRKNAEYGISKLEAIVAAGTKQKNIAEKGKLEDFLKLEDILKPLVSSHTQSGNPSEENPDEEKPEEEKPIEEEKPTNEE